MAKKKTVASVKPSPNPAPAVPTDWLESPNFIAGGDPPLDWLDTPQVTTGQDENLTGVLRPDAASKREQNARKREQKADNAPASASATPMLWEGKAVDLAEKIIDDHRAELTAGKITKTALLAREAPLWRKPDGKAFSAASMRNLLNERKNKRLGTPRH